MPAGLRGGDGQVRSVVRRFAAFAIGGEFPSENRRVTGWPADTAWQASGTRLAKLAQRPRAFTGCPLDRISEQIRGNPQRTWRASMA
jgi:hypothetical protein